MTTLEPMPVADKPLSNAPQATWPLPSSVLVMHAGKQHAYRMAAAVQQAGCLGAFATSGYYRPDCWPDRFFTASSRLDRGLRRRHLEGIDSLRVRRRWDLELPELLARRIVGTGQLEERLVFARDERFDRWVARRFASQFDICWGFQGSALNSLRAAKAAGRVAVLELATAHVTAAMKLLAHEAEQHPEWADSISNFRFPVAYRQRLEQEPHTADVCIAASSFTRQSLVEAGIAASRIELLPLGADLQQFAYSPRTTNGPLRVLFAGGIGQRKGIKYLLEAYTRVKSPNIELVLAGPIVGSGAALAQYKDVQHLGQIDQTALGIEMRRCHLLVLPSVFEGFGLVLPEAMATGMPVIASTHSIGPEMVREGVDGFVLPPDDIDGLAAKLDWFATHRAEAVEMGRCAAERAQEFSWQAHAARVEFLLRKIWHSCGPQSRCNSKAVADSAFKVAPAAGRDGQQPA